MRYNSAKDPKGRKWHYIWEGGGFGVHVYASGLRKWVQCGHAWNPGLEKRQPYFRSLGNLDQDRIVIPAHVERSKVRWKRHLDHMAYIIPITPEVEEILREIEIVAPDYGDAKTWLFPSSTSESGHMECEQNAVLRLREHSGTRFTAHQFRHNVASTAEDLGYSKPEIQELLGHARGSVTDRYIDERVTRYRKMLIAVNAAMREMTATEERSTSTRLSKSPGRSGDPGSRNPTMI